MSRIRLATCVQLPEPDADEAPLKEALTRAGIDFDYVGWDDPSVSWSLALPTVVRSTWNYIHRLNDFLTWADNLSKRAPLWNSVEVLRENTNKRYLQALAARGVPTCPTTVTSDPSFALASWAAEHQSSSFVIKPAIGAGSFQTQVFGKDEVAFAQAHLVQILQRGEALLQPFLSSVNDYGERSLVWIDGEFTHAIRKAPRYNGQAESVSGPMAISADELDVAERALAPYRDKIMYGRVDLARLENRQPVVMELELVEPSLFFKFSEAALARYVEAIRKRLG